MNPELTIASTSKRSNSVQRSSIIKEECCETDYDGISEGNYSGFHSEFVDVKEEPSVSPHVPNAFQGGNDLHSYIFNASVPLPSHPNEDSSRYVLFVITNFFLELKSFILNLLMQHLLRIPFFKHWRYNSDHIMNRILGGTPV